MTKQLNQTTVGAASANGADVRAAKRTTVGFIDLGRMGTFMAANLATGEHRVIACVCRQDRWTSSRPSASGRQRTSPISSIEAALATVPDRLYNFARVHYVLSMSEHSSSIDAAAYLRQPCRAISSSKLNAKGIKLLLVERPFQLNSERCWRLGLIVSELITNSARHAFRDSGGLIRVELLPLTSIIECRVTDNGTSEPIIFPGSRTKIITSLAKSLGGTIERHF